MFDASQTQYFHAMDVYVDRLSAYRFDPSVEKAMASAEASEVFF